MSEFSCPLKTEEYDGKDTFIRSREKSTEWNTCKYLEL